MGKYLTPDSHRFPCRLVVSDLDGTLLNSDYHLTPGVRRAINGLQKRTIPLVIASGREWPAVQMYYHDLELHTLYIGANGGFIYFPEENRVLHQVLLPGDTADFLLRELKSFQLAVFCCDLSRVYMAGDKRELQTFISDRRFDSVLCQDLTREGPSQLQKITLRGSKTELDRFKLRLTSSTDGVEMVFSGETCLEIIPEGVNKGAGVEIVADYLGVSLDDIVAVGDAMNDLPMLFRVGTSVAMGNAAAEVKAAAHYCAPSNDEDGAAMVFCACERKP
ncbi:MAG: HAD family phosphatase [Anaerolineales bacterium]|nr:HAD family phosphatase [Anaerolineales bacterium]